MARTEDQYDDAALERLLSGARRTAPMPDADFLARLEADMEDALPRPDPVAPKQGTTESFFVRFRGLFAASGLTGAAALGVWIGFVMPDTLNALSTGYDTTEASGIGAFLPYADLAALEE